MMKPVHCLNVEEESDGKPWYHDLKMFLKERAYPACATAVNTTIGLPILSQLRSLV